MNNNTPRRSLSFHNKSISQDMDSIISSPRYHRQRSYSPPPSTSSIRSPSLSKQKSDINLSRQNSEISLFEQQSITSATEVPWTRKQWELLEHWYDKRDRNCQRASMSFYLHESIDKDTNIPKWSKEYILWRCQCLDTNTKYHHGVLPSERKKRRDKIKTNKKLEIKKQQQQQQQDGYDGLLDSPFSSRNKGSGSNSSSRKNSFNAL